MIRFLDLREKLKNNDYAALCIYGNDGWLKRKSIANVCEVYGVTDDGFSVDNLGSSSERPTIEQINLACLTPSMFCAKKVVVCNNFAFPEGSTKLAEAKRQLSELIKQADGSFCLIFVADDCKHFQDVAGMETVNCNHLDKESVIKWIIAFAKRQGVAIDRFSADKIATYCLLDMSRVAVETQKLVDYGEITAESIDMLVHKDAEYAVYDLSDAIAKKDARRAIELYRALIARGEDSRALFGLIYNFYRRVYYVKTSAFSAEETANYLGVKVGSISFARMTAERYKPMQLKRALELLSTADERLKAFVDENEVMNLLIMQLVAL